MLLAVRGLFRIGCGVLCGLAALVSARSSLHAQTADPTATVANPVTTAPAAKTGSYTLVGGNLLVAPGLMVPNGNVPWALDTTASPPALVPIHHSSIIEPAEGGVRAAATAETPHTQDTLNGLHAHTLLRTPLPVFFVHTADRTENTGDAGRGNPTGWALLPAMAQGTSRVMPHVHFDQIAQGTACAAPVICLTAETLPDGWLRLASPNPLEAGDYALVPVPRQPRPGVLIVYDFTLDTAAPLAKDAVIAGRSAPAAQRVQHP